MYQSMDPLHERSGPDREQKWSRRVKSMCASFLANAKNRLTGTQHLLVSDYKEYLRLRGFGDHVNDSFFVQRGFLACWLEPGFHNFWRLWNPGISYFCFRLYLLLGGNKKRDLANVVVFFVNGLLHNFIFSLFTGHRSFPLPFTFLSFGILAIASRHLHKVLDPDQQRLPTVMNAAVNIGLVIVSFNFGFRVNDILCQSFG